MKEQPGGGGDERGLIDPRCGGALRNRRVAAHEVDPDGPTAELATLAKTEIIAPAGPANAVAVGTTQKPALGGRPMPPGNLRLRCDCLGSTR